jgi:hypothetical protein
MSHFEFNLKVLLQLAEIEALEESVQKSREIFNF